MAEPNPPLPLSPLPRPALPASFQATWAVVLWRFCRGYEPVLRRVCRGWRKYVTHCLSSVPEGKNYRHLSKVHHPPAVVWEHSWEVLLAEKNHLALLQWYIEQKPDFIDFWQVLTVAAKKDNIELVGLAIEQGVGGYHRPFEVAAKNGSLRSMVAIWEAAAEDEDKSQLLDEWGRSEGLYGALWAAIEHGQTHLIATLVGWGAWCEEEHYLQAAREGNCRMIQEMRKACPRDEPSLDRMLTCAAEYGQTQAVLTLLDWGAQDVDCAFDNAVRSSELAVMHLLRARKARGSKELLADIREWAPEDSELLPTLERWEGEDGGWD